MLANQVASSGSLADANASLDASPAAATAAAAARRAPSTVSIRPNAIRLHEHVQVSNSPYMFHLVGTSDNKTRCSECLKCRGPCCRQTLLRDLRSWSSGKFVLMSSGHWYNNSLALIV